MDAVTLPLAFLAGVVTFASPCFLPVVPVFITYLMGDRQPTLSAPVRSLVPVGGAGMTAGAASAPTPSSRRTALLHAGIFVAGFTVVFVGTWALISMIGWMVGDLRPALRIGGGVVLILLGLYAIGLLKIPALDRTLRARPEASGRRGPSVRRSAAMGLAFGAGWSPCIGPVLGVILGMAIVRDSAAAGIGLLIVFCLGLGLPFVMLALGASWVTHRLRWFGRHHRAIQIVSGVLLLTMGFLLVADLLAPLSGIVWFSI